MSSDLIKVSISFVIRDFYDFILSNIPFIQYVTVVAERAINSKGLFETMHTRFFL